MKGTRAKDLEHYLTAYLNALVDLDEGNAAALAKPLKKYREATRAVCVDDTDNVFTYQAKINALEAALENARALQEAYLDELEHTDALAAFVEKGYKKSLAGSNHKTRKIIELPH